MALLEVLFNIPTFLQISETENLSRGILEMRRIAYLYIANEGGVDSSSRFEVIQLIVRIMYTYSTGVVLFCKIVCSHTYHTV